MNLIVLVIDRLHAGFLGCYGNAWVATPHFNRLAAESFLFDQALVDGPDLRSLCQTWWTGRHRLEHDKEAGEASLISQLSQSGWMTTCLTDEPLVAEHPLATGFDEMSRVGLAAAEPQPLQRAESVEQTQAARFFAAAAQFLEGAREPFCLWLHSRGMQAAWDAPYSFREQYADDEESPPPQFVEPPQRRLTSQDDPDSLWGLCQAYAGQVMLVDECLGALFEALEAAQLIDDTVLVVLGARGFPLGRNGRLGDTDQALYGELVQTPWLVRFPKALGAAARSQALVQSCDLMPTLLDALDLASKTTGAGRSLMPMVREETLLVRDRLTLVGQQGECALRTPAWYLRIPATQAAGESPPVELYAKPDDRWEVNDVADRCPEIVAAMQAAHAASLESLRLIDPGPLPPLEEALTSELR